MIMINQLEILFLTLKQKSKINLKDGTQADMKPSVVDAAKGRKLTEEQHGEEQSS